MTDALLELVLAEFGPGALLCWDAGGSLIGSTQAFQQLFGLADCAAAHVDAIWARVRERCERDPGDLASAFAGGGSREVALGAGETSGSRLVRLRLRRLSAPRCLSVLLAQDVTEQKVAAARLHMLSRVVEQSADAVLLTDVHFRISYVNPAFETLFGWTLEELRGRMPDILNAEPDAEAYQQGMYSKLASGAQVFAEALNRRKDGSLFHCRYWVSPLHDDQGEVVGYLGSQRDVSVQVRAQQELSASETRYRLLTEHSSDLISKHRLDGTFLYVSSSCRVLLGYAPEEILGRSPYDFFHEEDLDAIRASHETILNTKSVYRVRYRMRRKDGAWVWLETNSHQVEDPEEAQGYVIIAQSRDVTEAHQLRQAMVQSQKMEALGRLTGGIAHDFNNILGSVLGFAELARLRNAGADAKLEGYLEQIDIAGGRARDLVRQLLVFSRGDSTLGAQPCPLAPMVKEVLKMLRPTLPSNLSVRFEDAAGPLVVEIDPLHVQQMLLNLMLNARDAMPEGGEIRVVLGETVVEEACAICRAWLSGKWIELSVSDRGCGIPDDNFEQLFQPFFTTKRFGEGSGMGLAVIAGLMRSYQGHVLVSSRLGAGSSFRLLLRPAQPSVEP
ncbi:PAS domain S-box protein [Thiorhodococcus mannitoliphagus]|uniref:histidine kinase n=1 Tax=Thiorhodococcus mannitoliphagus TaxID=329406 RepID=A0A6P1DUY0_9GAMM|nr:PAS domain-containing sensor histidine kinase [Thiorhodococcus mannitoliphagus]NEX21898.1 PAS domain S-box protein [Thiorhodococcus mannitoliphagus]